MRARTKVVLIALTMVVVVSAAGVIVGIVAVRNHFSPTWVEHYSVAGDQLQVIDQDGKPIPDALVIRIAVTGATSGGWDIHSVMIPATGTRPKWIQTTGATWNITAVLTDPAGKLAVRPFNASCAGSRGPMGCHQNDGLFAVVVYARGYSTATIAPGVDVPAAGQIHLYQIKPVADADSIRMRSIEELVEPNIENIPLSRGSYLNTVLPNGTTLSSFCITESILLGNMATDKYVVENANALRDLLQSGKPPVNGAIRPSLPWPM